MCKKRKVRWTVTPKYPPQPWISCSGCRELKPFKSSSKIRLNANGRKLDAWLIYKCIDCDKTWNRVIFERRTVRQVPPDVLEALKINDEGWIRRTAFDVGDLRRKVRRIEEFPDYEIARELVHEDPGWTTLEIIIEAPFAMSTRLDRLLSSELGLSRTVLTTLAQDGRLRCDQGDLRRRIRSGMLVTIDLPANPTESQE